MRIYYLLIILLLSCAEKDCLPSATCNDDTLEFGCKKDVCKNTGIKFYYPCKNKKGNNFTINSDC